jgi:hypothetical protein
MNALPAVSFRPLLSLSRLLAAVFLGGTLLLAGALHPRAWAADPGTLNGDLLVDAKGDVEIYYNGRKLVLRQRPLYGQHFVIKVPERAYKAGDVIVLRVRSPYVYRAVVAAINLTGKAGQIPIKKSDWRYLGKDQDLRKIGAAEIAACTAQPVPGTPDPDSSDGRGKLGILPESQGGSEWVKTEKQSNDCYCLGFVVTPEMLKAPLPVH